MKKGILFDLDGTLWDSSKEVADSWMLALQDFPEIKPVTREKIQSVMGKTMTEIADILFEGETKERRMELMSRCMEVENKYIEEHGGQLLEGLEETLEILRKKYHLYIVSNCQTGYIEAFLAYHKLGHYFEDYESFGNTKKSKGENIRLVVERNQLEQAVYVGDTQGDYEAAMFAGLPFIHAKTGYGTVEAEVPFVEKFAELPGVVAKIMDDFI